MKNTLIDAGPFIALFDKDDHYHATMLTFLKSYKGNLFSTWPVLTEVSHMLGFNVNVQVDFLAWIDHEAVIIVELTKDHLRRIIELTRKYSDVPMDLADSSLIAISETTGINNILTFDSDYYIYKTRGKKNLNNLLAPYIEKHT